MSVYPKLLFLKMHFVGAIMKRFKQTVIFIVSATVSPCFWVCNRERNCAVNTHPRITSCWVYVIIMWFLAKFIQALLSSSFKYKIILFKKNVITVFLLLLLFSLETHFFITGWAFIILFIKILLIGLFTYYLIQFQIYLLGFISIMWCSGCLFS